MSIVTLIRVLLLAYCTHGRVYTTKTIGVEKIIHTKTPPPWIVYTNHK